MEQRTAPFKRQKFKKIVAREGLIIISLLFLSAVSCFIDSWLNDQKEAYESNVQEIEALRKGVIVHFPKNTSDDVIEQTLKRDFPNIND